MNEMVLCAFGPAARCLASIVVGIACVLPTGTAQGSETELLTLLARSQVVAVMRHAIAPGTGDPEEFELRDCATQRNLSEDGRMQAVRAGKLFRQHGISNAAVLSSQWCRCLETARLLNIGEVVELEALNSFFRRFERRDAQTRALKDWLSRAKTDRPHVLVTHQVNITALTGRGVRSGEIVFLKIDANGAIDVAGSLVP